MSKRFDADTCRAVGTDAVPVFGGFGFNREYPVEKLYRDAKIFKDLRGDLADPAADHLAGDLQRDRLTR